MGDEGHYLKAKKEIESGTKDPAIWAKALALAEGDEAMARHEYVKYRVDKLSGNSNVEEIVKTGSNTVIGSVMDWKIVAACLLIGSIFTVFDASPDQSSGTAYNVGFLIGECIGAGLFLFLVLIIIMIPISGLYRLITKKYLRYGKRITWTILGILALLMLIGSLAE